MQLHREIDAIRARGAELVFIGNGNRHFAQAFKADYAIEAPVYVDTKRESYRAFGMRRGTFDIINFRSLPNMVRSLRAGFRPSLIQGDGRQLGGVVVVKPGGEVAYEYISNAGGDYPPVSDVLQSL